MMVYGTLPLQSLLYNILALHSLSLNTAISFMLFNELQRFLGEIETDNLTVSNSEIITFDFTVSKNRIFV